MAQDLWRIRRQRKMTIEELARKAGIAPGLIKAYELGQRAIPPEDIDKLAQALLVNSWDIKELSEPPPRGPRRSSGFPSFSPDPRSEMGRRPPPIRTPDHSRPLHSAGPLDRRDRSSRAPRKGRRRRQPAPSPARPSQIEHLKMLLIKLEMTGDDLLRLAGKPLSMLNRKEAAKLLTTCQNMLAEQRPPRPKGKRQRPYLPESVDEHELVYLTEAQTSKRNIRFTLFNGQMVEGQLMGFSPYALTVTQPDGQEITLQKLAVAYYQVEGRNQTSGKEATS